MFADIISGIEMQQYQGGRDPLPNLPMVQSTSSSIIAKADRMSSDERQLGMSSNIVKDEVTTALSQLINMVSNIIRWSVLSLNMG